jgi:outer membrane protein OmpA-like peptidoglycan-associated protein
MKLLIQNINRFFYVFTFLILCQFLTLPLFAQEWSYELTETVTAGQKATLSLKAPYLLKNVKIALSASGQKTVIQSFKEMDTTKTYPITWLPPKGISSWTAKITAVQDGNTVDAALEFEITSGDAAQIFFVEEGSDLASGSIYLKATQAIERAELDAFGDEGESLWQQTVVIAQEKGIYLVKFEPRGGPIPRRVELKVYDSIGNWIGLRIVRWYAEVPHEDVLFESAKSEILGTEQPKMNRAVKAVLEEIEKFKKAMGTQDASIDLQLYVSGYTDTVGNPSDNERLSRERAKAIASYFKKQGLPIQIFYAGFGERALAIQTADQQDEPKNRRALYVVANHFPSGPNFPSSQWTKLP